MAAEKPSWCDKHWQPYRENRKANGLYATIAMTQRFVGSEEFMKACGRDDEKGTLADVSLMNQMMEGFKPICCYLGDEAMNVIYMLKKIRRLKERFGLRNKERTDLVR